MWDLVLKNGSCWVRDHGVLKDLKLDIAIRENKIAAVGASLDASQAQQSLSLEGLDVLPGVIDSQVHFREPGMVQKEDLSTGTMAAALGGVTAVFEMPNTKPATASAIEFGDKVTRTQGRIWCDVGFFVGATRENLPKLGDLERLPGAVGVKVFMGTSTGDLLLKTDEDLRELFKYIQRRAAFHCEDEFVLRENEAKLSPLNSVLQHPQVRSAEVALRATQRAIAAAEAAKKRVHILHVTTRDEMEFLSQHKTYATVEVTPQHLLLSSPECYERLGTLVQMNPPIREKEHTDGLWAALKKRVVDVIATDHAPHTLDEKARPYPNSPSGLPGTQTMLPLLLNFVNQGRLDMSHLIELICENPARIYSAQGLGEIKVGHRANLTVVDLRKEATLSNKQMASKCGWTPYDGMKVRGWPVMTLVGGKVVMRDGEMIGSPVGQLASFDA